MPCCSRKTASGKIHSCSPIPPTPSGFSSLWSGPATKPSSDIEMWNRSLPIAPGLPKRGRPTSQRWARWRKTNPLQRGILQPMSTHTQPTLSIAHPHSLFVGGEWVDPTTTDTLPVVSPSTEEVVLTFAEAKEADMDRAVAAAREAFDRGPWPRTSSPSGPEAPRGRRPARARHSELAEAWTVQVGAPISFTNYASGQPAGLFEYYAGLIEEYPIVDERRRDNGGLVRVVTRAGRRGRGDHALERTARPALLQGRGRAGGRLHRRLEAGAGDARRRVHARRVHRGGRACRPGSSTSSRPAARWASTSSATRASTRSRSPAAPPRDAGSRRSRRANRPRQPRAGREVGGDRARRRRGRRRAPSLVPFSMLITGQVCFSLTRVLVPRAEDRAAGRVRRGGRRVKVGDPFDAATQMGPLAMAAAAARVRGIHREGQGRRGDARRRRRPADGLRPRLLRRAHRVRRRGNTHDDRAGGDLRARVSFITYDRRGGRGRIANDTIYGLHGAVYTQTPSAATSRAACARRQHHRERVDRRLRRCRSAATSVGHGARGRHRGTRSVLRGEDHLLRLRRTEGRQMCTHSQLVHRQCTPVAKNSRNLRGKIGATPGRMSLLGKQL